MQSYSELANWDGSLSAPLATSTSAPSSPHEQHTPTHTILFPDVSVMFDSPSPPSPPDSILTDKVKPFLSPFVLPVIHLVCFSSRYPPSHIPIATTPTHTLTPYMIYTTNFFPNLTSNKFSRPIFFPSSILANTTPFVRFIVKSRPISRPLLPHPTLFSSQTPMNPSFLHKNARLWRISLSIQMTPPRGLRRGTTRLCQNKTRDQDLFRRVYFTSVRQDFRDDFVYLDPGSPKVKIAILHSHITTTTAAYSRSACRSISHRVHLSFALCPTGTDHRDTFEITTTFAPDRQYVQSRTHSF
jgi:hypothetical protein